MSVEGLSQPELAGLLRSGPFARSLARIALHTEATRFEGGFVIGRAETSIVLSSTVLAQEADTQPHYDEHYEIERGGMVLPKIPRSVGSFHTHPYLRPLTPADFTNIQPSPDDMIHIQHGQRRCENYIAGIIGLRTHASIILALHRTTQPLPARDILIGQYDRAMSGDFDAELNERLGIKTVRIIFNLIRSSLREPRALPPRGRRRLREAIAPLFTE